MPTTASFRVGLTSDFETHAKGVIEPAIAEVLEPVSAIEIETMRDTGGVAQPAELNQYDAVIALDYYFPAASFQGVKRLALIARWGVGYDRIDIKACTAADVIVAITRDSIRRPVAEGILALMFALAKNLPSLDRSCRTGGWRQNPPRSINLEGRTLGSIGLGNIAGEMFRLARALGLGRLLAFSPRASAAESNAIGVELAPLETVMRESDFVVINCPLTDETRGLITARRFKRSRCPGQQG